MIVDKILEELHACREEKKSLPPPIQNTQNSTLFQYLAARIATLEDVLRWINETQ